MSSEQGFWDVVEGIRESDPRFRREAYAFLMAGLGVTVQGLPAERLDDPDRRHLSGRELLAGLTHLAREQFGALAPMVFAEWGVTCGEDVGDMVFQLVRGGQLSARPEDTLDDFRGYDLARELLVEADRTPRA
jgi:uncharacterized repeat protein (TIGR04138 family)